MIERIKLSLLERGLSEDTRALLRQVEGEFRALVAEGRDESNLEDCTHVLTTCNSWIIALEEGGVPDEHPLLISARDHMRTFLPTYTAAHNEEAEKLMAHE